MDICVNCDAKCCRYFVMDLKTPRSNEDFDKIRWYLAHENVVVYVDKGKWYLDIKNRCRYIGADNKCVIYDTRPGVCREHDEADCEYHDQDYGHEHVFGDIASLEAYIAERSKGPSKKQRRL
ncbi:MAG: YkgJ family cysteine cluster protein [Candidatus Omnitrophica bacterium]|nr:YkgJ family cysteine cluster protein [Candidatus Omnitrophota bacterium]